MAQHSQTEFYIERMQPDWLLDDRLRQLYRFFAVEFGFVRVFLPFEKLGSRLASLVFGLTTSKLEIEIKPAETIAWSWVNMWQGLFKTLKRGLVFSLVVGLVFGLIVWLIVGVLLVLVSGLTIGLYYGFASGFSAGLIFALLLETDTEIEPKEIVVWLWEEMRHELVAWLLAGLFLGSISGLLFWLVSLLIMGSSIWSIVAFPIGVLGGLFLMLFGMIFINLFTKSSSKMMDKKELLRPNQGIWYSVRNGVLIGFLGGLIIASLFTLLAELMGYGFNGVIFGLFVGALCSLWLGLQNGGEAFIQHFMLRLLLWRAGFIPWHYPHFLDYAAERILLRKVGGGYIFVHRLLLGYFALLDTTP